MMIYDKVVINIRKVSEDVLKYFGLTHPNEIDGRIAVVRSIDEIYRKAPCIYVQMDDDKDEFWYLPIEMLEYPSVQQRVLAEAMIFGTD